MKYTRFEIHSYRGIDAPIVIDLEKSKLVPIIGINESGKTTILKAIYSFDIYNDEANSSIKQLDESQNLYKASPRPPLIAANVSCAKQDLYDALNVLKKNTEIVESKEKITFLGLIETYRNLIRRNFKGELLIYRNLLTRKYSVHRFFDKYKNDVLLDAFVGELMRFLPYILYFDDFRDSIVDRIEIRADHNGNKDYWLQIIEQLFESTGNAYSEKYSLFDLPTMDGRRRDTILSKVNKRLHDALTKHWANLHVEDKRLNLEIGYEEEPDATVSEGKRCFLKFNVIENHEGVQYHFYVKDRSKGFYWFFNFVMKLEFNPKRLEDSNTIYLLDEPGSYLHASAQSRLCEKLRELSAANTVIYCTHSHYLLDPDIIPINTVKVAVKNKKTQGIELKSIHQHSELLTDRKSAFQPIADALQIKPFLLDLNFKNVLMVEGIYDYYCFEMFKKFFNIADLHVFPGTNADSLRYLISLMIATQVNYRVIWDNDSEGRACLQKAKRIFGEVESEKFNVLPYRDGNKDRRLEDLFTFEDLSLIASNLGQGATTFEKMIVALYYHKDRERILDLLSSTTKKVFEKILNQVTMEFALGDLL